MKNIKQKPWNIESDNTSEWILMDYSDIILHIFQEETRNLYNIEELWGDTKKLSHN
jgi:ribosome-associated protein